MLEFSGYDWISYGVMNMKLKWKVKRKTLKAKREPGKLSLASVGLLFSARWLQGQSYFKVVLGILTETSFVAHHVSILYLKVTLMTTERNDVVDVIRVFCRTILYSESDVVVIRLELPTKTRQEMSHFMQDRLSGNTISEFRLQIKSIFAELWIHVGHG